MLDTEKLDILKSLIGIEDGTHDSALAVYLRIAKHKILSRVFPFDYERTHVPEKYELLQCEIAAYLWNKRGAEGEISHNENGISRTYENADVPLSMLKDIVPYCGVFKEEIFACEH